MEGTIDMTSNTASNNITAAAPAPHNHQQEAVVVSSPPPTKKEQTRNTKKPRAAQQAGGEQAKPRPPQDAALCCPRCRSTNTKFCYYNNYNLTQPRYICKTCRRYWTQGGSLRHVPVGGGCRRNNKRSATSSGSSSSSAASSTAASSAEVTARLTILMPNSSTRSMPSPTTGLLPSGIGMPPAITPTGGSGLDLAMVDGQQGFLPFPSLPLSDDHQAPPELAPGGGGSDDTAPTLLDTLTLKGGYPGGGGSAAGLAMSDGSNGMDMSFLLPGMGGSATDDPMQTQLVEGMMMNDVVGELQWASSELDNYINDDGGYAYAAGGAGPVAGVEQQQQQVVGGQQLQEEDSNKATESNKNNNDGGGSPSPVYNYLFNTNNNDGAEG